MRSRSAAAPVFVEMLGLPADGRLPSEAEPGQVLADRRLELGPAAGDVDVLDAQEEPAARPRREIGVEESRIGVTEMQPPVRARSEAEGRLDHACPQLSFRGREAAPGTHCL